MDGVFYTNHLFGGVIGQCKINGSLVARDEACIYSTKLEITWDIRLGSKSIDSTDIDIVLPMSLRDPKTVHFREL